MKKTKFLTCLAALTLLLAGCETTTENLDSDTSTTESGDTTTSDTGTSGDTGTGEGGEEEGESRLGLLGEAFKLVGGANYTLTCYSTAVNTDDHLSYSGYVTSEGAISTSYTGSTTGMINDPDDGGFVEVTLDGDLLKASAAPDPTKSVQDYYISSNIDTALFEELEDGRFALKDEGFTSDVLQDLFPDKPFTGGLITPTQGTIFIEVEDDLSKVTYYYDSSFLGNYTVTLVLENLGTTAFPYDLSTQYVKWGSETINSWAAYLTETQKTNADNILGADMDDILPFYVPEVGYQFNTMNGKINLYAQSAGYDLCEPWAELLVEFGYEEVTADKEYKLEGDTCNYTVTLNNYGGTSMFDLYLYPTEKPSESSGIAEQALEFIKSVDDKTQSLTEISWDAFHYYDGEEGGLFNEEISEEGWLTTKDGELFGYIDEVDDDEMEEYHTYYQNGIRFYDNDGSKSYSEEYTQTYDDLLETQLDNAYTVFEVLENAVEAAEEENIILDGTSLTISATTGSIDSTAGGSTSTTTYVLESDSAYNLTKISSEKVKTDVYTTGQTAVTTTKYLLEQIDASSVNLPEDFDPEDFGYTAQENPDTGAGSSPVSDILSSIYENPNYTIVLQITDYQSNETAYDPNGFSPYVQLEPLQDLWCKITYTTESAVVEYYGSYDELLAGTVMDVEYYLNTDSGVDVFMVYAWYEVNPVYFQWAEEGKTWQDCLGSLFGLEDYLSNFVEGETTTTERGTEVSYTLDNLDSDFLEALIDALVDNGNYWAWETHGVEQILLEGADVSYAVTYLEDSEIIEFVFVSDEYTYHDEDNFCYYLEQTTINVYVLDVGSSSTPEYTLDYGS